MSKLDLQQKLAAAVEEHEGLLDYLKDLGVPAATQPAMLATMGSKVSLKMVLKMKGLDEEAFLTEWQRRLDAREAHESDGGLAAGSEGDTRTFKLDGVLPCPIKLPLSQALLQHAQDQGLTVQADFVSANLGLDGMLERLNKATESGRSEDLPDVLSSAGFAYFFSHNWLKNYAESGLYGAEKLPLSEEFARRGADLADPKGFFRIVAVVPAVFIVRRSAFPDGNWPKSWADLIHEDCPGSLSIPHGDLDLFNALALTVSAKWGREALGVLARRCSQCLHPSQMVVGRTQQGYKPDVSIAPYFFASMIQDKDLLAIWPEDGAILSPVFLTYRLNAPEIAPLVASWDTPEISAILSHNGRFPATRPGTDNHLSDDMKMLWVGWDYLYSHDVEKELAECEDLFRVELEKAGGRL